MDINNILIKYFGNKASKEELIQLEQWKEETAFNMEKMKEMKSLWEASNDMKGWDEFDSNQAWNKIDTTINQQEQLVQLEQLEISSDKTLEKKLFSLNNIMKIAAIGLLLFLSKSAYDYMEQGNTNTSTKIIQYAALDIKKEVTLPDGTAIVLSPKSSIEIKENFSKQRDVKLKGNAFFKVHRDESNPFTVHTSKGNIKVLGTSFNILNHQGIFELFVSEGKVAYSFKDRTVTLRANDLVTLNNDNIIKTKMYENNYLSWKNNNLVFRDAQWIDVFKDLKRHFHIKIDYSNIQHSDCKLNSIFSSENIEEVLKELELLWNIKYKLNDNNELYIESIKC